MLKFILAARRKREDTQARYFYEWGVIHVALMVTNPVTYSVFRRYAQHFTINDIPEHALWFPRSAMEWDNMADHWLTSMEALGKSVQSEDYALRMQPHKFGGDDFCVELTDGRELFIASDFANGGVKLIHFLRKRPEDTEPEFDAKWRDQHGALVVKELTQLGILRKYVQNPRLPFDVANFKGTLFEKGGMGTHAGIEEFWFSSLADLETLRASPAWERLRDSYAALVADGSFSMVTTERVVLDYATPGLNLPPPAAITPGTLEYHIDQQGYAEFNVPKPPGAAPGRRPG